MVVCRKTRTHLAVTSSFLVLLLLSGSESLSNAAQEKPYRILVTNDDGIEAPGIKALALELRKVGDVVVVAPSENQSGSSMSLTEEGAVLRAEEHELDKDFFGYGINGSAALAAFFGILEIGKGQTFDLVVSGINAGQNVGDLAHFSGTVGAAMTAVYLGVPAVAVSLDAREKDYRFAAEYTARFVKQLMARGAPAGVVLSINIPAGKPEDLRGVVPARMGGSFLRFGFEKREDPRGRPYYWTTREVVTDFPANSDSEAYKNKEITITPLRFDWTDDEMLKELKEWDLGIQ